MIRNLSKLLLIACLSLFIAACAFKKPEKSEAVSLIINAAPIKLSAEGFLYESKNLTGLEAYSLAKAIFALKITDKICLNQACYDKKSFNERFFKVSHYDDFLSDILSFKPIYHARNLKKTKCGFEQNLNAINYEIFYRICNEELKFRDFKNQILIKIKKQGR